jgi:hypothetical protein
MYLSFMVSFVLSDADFNTGDRIRTLLTQKGSKEFYTSGEHGKNPCEIIQYPYKDRLSNELNKSKN